MRPASLLLSCCLAGLLLAPSLRAQAPAPLPEAPAADEDDDAPRAAAPAPVSAAMPSATALQTLRDPGSATKAREDAVRALAFQPSQEGDEELARLAVEDPEVSVRFLSVRALERRKHGGPALAQVLAQDTDPRVRAAAARALGQLGPDGTRQEAALLAGLQDPVPAVGMECIRALRAVGSRAALDTLRRIRADENNPETRDAAKPALKAIRRRTAAVDARRVELEDRKLFREAPWKASPLLGRVLRFGGSVYAVGMGAAMGATAGALVPMAAFGKNGVYAWPLTAGFGAVAGGLSGLGYAALRRFDLPLTDAVLISVHGASGFLGGLGLGMWLGKRSTPWGTAATALLAGTAAGAASAGASPWLRTRPSMVVSAVSGGALGASATFLAASAMGVDPVKKSDKMLGLVLLGQGVGTALGTGLGIVPITSSDIMLVDLGAVGGVTALAVATLAATWFSPAKVDARISYGTVLGGMVLGAGTGALAAALLPTTLENRLTGGLTLEQLPVTLLPGVPAPTVDLSTGKVTGATVPLLTGLIR